MKATGWGSLFTLLLCLAACGGGSGGGGDAPLEAPEAISYGPAPFVLRTETPTTLPPDVTGASPTEWRIEPALPEGLTLDAEGRIVGTVMQPMAPTQYVITAGNEAGETSVTVILEFVWAEYRSLATKADLTDADIRHFLDRTHFGFSQADYQAIQTNGLAAHVVSMTNFEDTAGIEDDAFGQFIRTEFDPDGRFPQQHQIARWWLHVMAENPNPFQEVLALHWHNHFATSSVFSILQAKWMIDHVNIWRHGGTGNLRTLLIDMARDKAMLVWLDGILNDGGEGKEPNENFAREFFELYCLGIDVDYTEADIQEAARAFSGYQQAFSFANGFAEFIVFFEPERHDHGEKQIFGQTIPAQDPGPDEHDDYEAVVDITLGLSDPESGAPRVGQWIVRNLLEHFCFDDPPQNVIDDLATQLRDDNWELRPILQRLLLSEMFFSARAQEGRIKGPTDYLMGFMRTTGLRVRADQSEPQLQMLRHVPTMPPSVNGWPGGQAWLSAQAMLNTANLLHIATEGEKENQTGQGQRAVDLLPTPNATAAETLDSIALRMQIELTAAERTRAIEFLETQGDVSGQPAPVPWDPTNEERTEGRVRGLLWVLGQHPSYMVR